MDTVESRLAKLEVIGERTEEQVKEVLHLLRGNGQPGLVTRVDRLEQTKESQRRHFWIIWAAVVGLVGKFLWETLR
jgi:hypothetical protein